MQPQRALHRSLRGLQGALRSSEFEASSDTRRLQCECDVGFKDVDLMKPGRECEREDRESRRALWHLSALHDAADLQRARAVSTIAPPTRRACATRAAPTAYTCHCNERTRDVSANATKPGRRCEKIVSCTSARIVRVAKPLRQLVFYS